MSSMLGRRMLAAPPVPLRQRTLLPKHRPPHPPPRHCPLNKKHTRDKHRDTHTSTRVPPLLASPPSHRREGDILSLPRQLGVLGVVLLHVAAAAAAGGVDVAFDGGRDEVLLRGGGVDGRADVAGAAAAVGGFGVGGGDEVVGHGFYGAGVWG